jgi:hypothetical protein
LFSSAANEILKSSFIRTEIYCWKHYNCLKQNLVSTVSFQIWNYVLKLDNNFIERKRLSLCPSIKLWM